MAKKIKEKKEIEEIEEKKGVGIDHPDFDPSLPESKQRDLR